MFEAIKNYGRRYSSWTSWGFNAGQETAASLVEFVPFALVRPARVESGMTFATREENTYGVTRAHRTHGKYQAHVVDVAHDDAEVASSISSLDPTEYTDSPAQAPVDGLLRRMFTWPVRAVSRYVVGGVVGAFTGAIAAVVAIPAAFVADANDVLPAPGYVANHLNEQRGSAVKWAMGVALLAVAGFAGYVVLTFGVAALAVAAPIVLPAVAALGLLAGVGKLVFSYTAYAERTAQLNRAEALCKQLAELAQNEDTPVYNMDYKTPEEVMWPRGNGELEFKELALRQAAVAAGEAIRTALPVYINDKYNTYAETHDNYRTTDDELSARVAAVLAGRAVHVPSLSRIYHIDDMTAEVRHALKAVPSTSKDDGESSATSVMSENAKIRADNRKIDVRNAQRQAIRNNTAINTQMDPDIVRECLLEKCVYIRETINTIQSKIAAGEDCSRDMPVLSRMQDLSLICEQVLDRALIAEACSEVKKLSHHVGLSTSEELSDSALNLFSRIENLENKAGKSLRDINYMINKGMHIHERYPSLHKQVCFLQYAVSRLVSNANLDLTQPGIKPSVEAGRVSPSRFMVS